MKKSYLFILFSNCLFVSAIFGKSAENDTGLIKKVLPPIQKFFVGNALDGAIFSTANIQNTTKTIYGQPTTTTTMGTIRFSLVVNVGFTFNFNLGRHIGLYTGIDVKNIGFIEKNEGGETVKRRTYNLGAPVGLKLGNMAARRGYIFLGGGMDMPFNYKEKSFAIRNEKTKTSEWFANNTPSLMPYVFAGMAISSGATFKVQYYPDNFLNTDYSNAGAKPYAGMDVHLILFSLGFNMRYGKHPDIVETHVADLKTM